MSSPLGTVGICDGGVEEMTVVGLYHRHNTKHGLRCYLQPCDDPAAVDLLGSLHPLEGSRQLGRHTAEVRPDTMEISCSIIL